MAAASRSHLGTSRRGGDSTGGRRSSPRGAEGANPAGREVPATGGRQLPRGRLPRARLSRGRNARRAAVGRARPIRTHDVHVRRSGGRAAGDADDGLELDEHHSAAVAGRRIERCRPDGSTVAGAKDLGLRTRGSLLERLCRPGATQPQPYSAGPAGGLHRHPVERLPHGAHGSQSADDRLRFGDRQRGRPDVHLSRRQRDQVRPPEHGLRSRPGPQRLPGLQRR